MTTTASAGSVTARSVLFPRLDGDGQLRRALDDGGVARSVAVALGAATRGGREAAAAQVTAVVDRLLDLELDDLLLHGWKTHAALVAAARRTLAAPGSREVVELAAHRTTSQREFCVDVLLERLKVAQVHLVLTAEFLVEALVGVVADGLLLDVRGGDCRVTVTLEAEGTQLARRTGSLPLPGRVRLGAGVDLLSRSPADTVPRQPST